MKPVYQTIYEPPLGNCLQAGVASILELTLEEVPNFAEVQGPKWWDRYAEWMKEQNGLYPLYLKVFGDDDPLLKELQGYHLIVGKSPRGDWLHVVVAKDGKVVHDPNPQGDGSLEEVVAVELFVSLMENGHRGPNG